MAESGKWSEAIPWIGIGVLGLVHEYVISAEAELFPIILFGLLIIKGLERGLRRTA